MRLDEKRTPPPTHDDFEDISIIKNLLELQIRLRAETDSIENPIERAHRPWISTQENKEQS